MPNYPGSLDDDVSLFLAVNNARTRLTSGINISDLTIPVVTTSGFPNQGFVTILTNPDDITEAEAIAYTGVTETSFSGTARGSGGTPVFAHAAGNNVDLTVMAEHHNEIKNAVIALEQIVGISGSHNFVPKDAQGNVLISGTLTVQNLAEFGWTTTSGSQVVTGPGFFETDLDVAQNMVVSGTSSLAGDVDMKSTLTVSGVAAFGQAPVDATAAAAAGTFDDTPATTSSATFTTVLTSASLGTDAHLLFYRGNIGLDSSSTSTGDVEIQARLAGSVIGFGGGDNIEKLGHQQSAEIAGFKVVDLPGSTADIQVRSVGASTTAEYGALGIMSIPLDAKGLVENTDYWFDNGSDTEVLISTGDNGIDTRNTFNFTVPETGDYLILLSLEARGTREVRVRYRLDGALMVALQEIGNNIPSPFPAAVIRTLTAGPHTLLHQQGHDNTSSATSRWNRMRFFVLKTSAFDNIQDTEDSTPVVTADSSFTHLSALQQTFVPLIQQQVAVLGIGAYNTVSTSTNVTAASYKLVNSTDAEDYSLDSGMQIYNQGSGALNHATLMFRLLDAVASSKTFQMHFRNSSGDAQGVEHNEGSLITWGLAPPVVVPDIPLTTVDGNDITTHSINSDLASIRNVIVSEDITISGALTGGLLTAASGTFSESLTISGVPVSTGTGGGGAGNITDINAQTGPSITITGTAGIGVITTGNTITIDGTDVQGSGGGGVTISGCYTHIQSSASAAWNITHNLASVPVNYIVLDNSDVEVIPDTFTVNDADSVTITFVVPQAGTADIFPCISGGGGGDVTDPLVLASGVFSQSLTISGVPVSTGTGGGGGAALTVKEVDGDPSVANVDTIVVTNGTLTDDGSGQVTITISGSASISFSGAVVTTSGWDTSGTNGIVSWSGAHYNVGSWWNISEGTRFTVPAGVNYIRSDSQFHLLIKTSNPAANKTFGASLYHNGSITQPQVRVKHVWDQGITNAQSIVYQLNSPVIPVNEGDYFELAVDDSTNDADVLAVRTYFSIEKVG